MHPLTLTIEGDFWDSHLYHGHLILFDIEGRQRTIDWHKLVESLTQKFEQPTRDLISNVLTSGSWGYAAESRALFHEPLIQKPLHTLFNQVPERLEISKQLLEEFELGREDSTLPYAFSDSICYQGALFAVAQEGIFLKALRRVGLRKRRTTPAAKKLWDAPVSGIDAYDNRIGLAAGTEGLVVSELPPRHELESTTVPGFAAWRSLCNDCDFAADGILGFAQGLDAAFVTLPRKQSKKELDGPATSYNQQPPTLRRAEEVFGRSLRGAVVWGSRHQLCYAKDSMLLLARLPAKSARLNESRPQISSVELQPIKGRPVSGGTAVFGAILETDNCVVVAQSDGKFHNIWGEATSWRVFPRSDYCNQLHVVLDSHLEITAFVHDWFLDQATKKVGEPFAPFRIRSSGSP